MKSAHARLISFAILTAAGMLAGKPDGYAFMLVAGIFFVACWVESYFTKD